MKKLWYVGLLLLAQESYAQKWEAITDIYDDKIYGYEKNENPSNKKEDSLLTAVEPVKEVIAVEPVKEVIAVEPVKEVIAVEPVKEVIAVEPSKEVIAVEPVKEVIAVEPSKETVTIDYQSSVNFNTNQAAVEIAEKYDDKVSLRLQYDLKQANIVNIYGVVIKAGTTESVKASEQAKKGQFISISYEESAQPRLTQESSDVFRHIASE